MGFKVHPFADDKQVEITAVNPILQHTESRLHKRDRGLSQVSESWSPRRESLPPQQLSARLPADFLQHQPSVAQIRQTERRARYASKGLDALWELVKLYCHILYPVVLVSLWMFGMFAFFSYMVPKVFCKSTVISSQGTSNGFRPCIYNSGGSNADYSKDTGVKVLWLIFWVVQQAWLVGFSSVMGHALFGKYLTWKHWVLILSVVLAIALHMVIHSPLRHLGLDSALYVGLPAGVGIIVAGTVAHACVQYSRDKVNGPRWFLLMAAAGGVVTIYFIIIPRIVTARATSTQLLLTRLIIHPIIWGMLTLMFTHTARHIGEVPNMMQTTIYIWPYMYNSLYGRFLLLQLGGTGNVLILNILISLYSVVGKLASRSTLGLLLKLLYGQRTSEAMQTANAMVQIRMAETFAHIISEHAGILCASAIFSFGSVASVRGVKPDDYLIWKNAGLQICTALITDFVAMAVDWKFHSIDFFSHWVKDMRQFILYMLIVVTFGGVRLNIELLLLFCPSYSAETGVLLEYCDVPSLFSALDF